MDVVEMVKSVLVELMGVILGDYKATVPLTLITQKRTSIGGVSPEVAGLKGTRYAVMQEPSKGTKLNEGVMKRVDWRRSNSRPSTI